ncbi:uncharacterized protein B0H18DRAFT_955688 [Fomitopsis serialis]|uniref:uncharacterized protein n=1 Tax=Fomitopsis serialis TaxID=139415 RepID=UPI002008DDD5|nr:uncharacterized protein B0H18DRAFT_955688 [Neoantrodia serialis]KAH9923840.1 hypothetical protein B0H18DRAFT_955688 [Neoantrodia serialis]
MKLEPEQRSRILKSGQKVNKMLGATPVIDVVSPGKSALTPISTPRSALNASVLDGKRAPLRAFTAPSPARRVHIATTRADTYDNGLKSPVLQITVTSPSNENQDASAHTSKTTNAGRGIRRKKVPAALPLNQASRTEALPLSPFRYATLKAVKAPSLSPVAPFSPFSPITVKKVEESKVEKLQNLEKLAQYSAVGIPQEMIYPSFGQVEEKTEQITCFLDLYRMGTMGQVPGRSASLASGLHTAPVPVPEVTLTSPTAAVTALLIKRRGRANSRSSTGSMKRRSRSAGDFYSVTDALALESPSFGARMNSQLHAASVLSPVGTYSAFLAPPEPVLSAGRASFTSALFSPSIYSQISARSAEFPLSPELVTSPVQRQRTIAKARRSILTDDAQRMATFRTRFGVRPLEFALPVTPLPLPMGPLPSPPMSPAPPAEVRSPRVPYWVKSSYRPRDSTHALELVNMRYDPEGKRRSAKRKTVLPTPTTQRFERRMGWGGEWNQGGMANWVDSLKQL